MPQIKREYQKYRNGHAHGKLLYPIFMNKKHPDYGARYKILSGGRDAAKTIAITRFLIERILTDTGDDPLVAGFIRGNLKDTRTSCAIVLRNWIHTLGMERHFHIPDNLEAPIIGPNGSIIYMIGANEQTAGGIKSFEGLRIVILEEAQYINDTAWKIITPTIRQEDSEIWVNFNPRYPTDPISTFVKNTKGDPDVFHIHLTYRDNQYRTKASETERRLAKKNLSKAEYEHDWEGKFSLPGIEETLLPLEWLETCEKLFDQVYSNFPSDMVLSNHQTGTDLGISPDGDGNCHVRRAGPFLLKAHKWRGQPLHQSAEAVDTLNRPYAVTREYYDPIGIGAGYSVHRPQARPVAKNSAVAGEEIFFTSGVTNKDHFMNRGAQLGWLLRMRAQNTFEKFVEKKSGINVEDCLFINPQACKSPIEQSHLMAQLSQPLWDTDNVRETIHIEKQPEGCPSPNYYDATAYAFASDSSLGLKEGRVLTPKHAEHAYHII